MGWLCYSVSTLKVGSGRIGPIWLVARADYQQTYVQYNFVSLSGLDGRLCHGY